MGTNNSKVLKTQYEKGYYKENGQFNEPRLREVKSILIEGFNSEKYFCMVRELDTEKYTQTLSKVDEFLEKMNNTSPFISSFFFITESKQKANTFNLIFESGQQNLQYRNLISDFTKVFECILSALEFLEGIQLFHPFICLDSIVKITNKNQKFKLINQFCYSDFLNFITNIYLSNNKSQSDLRVILKSKRIQNLREFQDMVNQMINHHPEIRNSSHFLSNLTSFQSYLNQIDLNRFSYRMIKDKFKEFFDIDRNRNKNFNSNISQSYIGRNGKLMISQNSNLNSSSKSPLKIGKKTI